MSADLSDLRRLLRRGIALAGVVAVAALAIALLGDGTVPLGTPILFTALVLGIGGAVADIALGAVPGSPRAAAASIGALLVALVCTLLLVWTDWKMGPTAWRVWWIASVAAITSAWLLALRRATGVTPRPLEQVTSACVALSALLLASLALRARVPPEVGTVFLLVTAGPAAVAVVGTLALVVRHLRGRDVRLRPGRAVRAGLLLGSWAVIFLLGVYIGDRQHRRAGPFEALPSALAGLAPDEIDRRLGSDLERLERVTAGLDDLARSAAALEAEVLGRMEAEGRTYYLPEEDDRLRWHFVTYLSYRAELLRIVGTYASFEAVADPDRRARCFLVGLAAAVTLYDAALDLIEKHGERETTRRKLNEPEPAWGIPAGLYDRIYEGATDDRNLAMCREMGAYYRHQLPRWREAGVWPGAELGRLAGRIDRGLESVLSRAGGRPFARLDLLLERVKQDTYSPIYAAQSILSEWIGDTTIVEVEPLITVDQIRAVAGRLEPGDIILERRNWFLSNAFLPGFWPHSALYVGTLDDLERLGVAEDPAVRSRLEEYLAPAEDGEPHAVIEAVSDGVIFNSLTHSMHADYVAVLRPRLPVEKKARAIVRAFSHHGKPYDFEFDFFTSDKLVCTELLHRSYEGMLGFDLVRVMGRDTLPAVEIVRQFARERGREDRRLDFVLFLDGSPEEGRAREADEEEFSASAERPRAFHR